MHARSERTSMLRQRVMSSSPTTRRLQRPIRSREPPCEPRRIARICHRLARTLTRRRNRHRRGSELVAHFGLGSLASVDLVTVEWPDGSVSELPSVPTGQHLTIVAPAREDLNGDGWVDGADVGLLLSSWGPCATCADCPADLDGDCMVGGSDLGIVLGAWSAALNPP
jgi:hypothetical protein